MNGKGLITVIGVGIALGTLTLTLNQTAGATIADN